MTETNLRQTIDSIIRQLDQIFYDFTPLTRLAKKLNKKPGQICILSILIIFIILCINIASLLFSTLFSIIYPAYMSFKAIQSNSHKDDKQWLTYWVVLSFLTIFDNPLSIILGFLPFYYMFKVIFYLWMYYPKQKGAQKIYDYFINPIYKKLIELNKNK